jgi:hypothetical protein
MGISATQHRNRARYLLHKLLTAPKPIRRLMRQRAVLHLRFAYLLDRDSALNAEMSPPTIH